MDESKCIIEGEIMISKSHKKFHHSYPCREAKDQEIVLQAGSPNHTNFTAGQD